MNRRFSRLAATLLALSIGSGCALRGDLHRPAMPLTFSDEARLTLRRLQRPAVRLARSSDTPHTTDGRMLITMIRRQFLERLAPLAVSFSVLISAPVHAVQQLDLQRQDQPIVRRRAPEGHRRNALAFVRTELFFGTAKPAGAVTEEEFKQFLDGVVTPLFPDGLTVIKADGQFKGANGVTIKEDSFVLILLYPVDGQKASSKNIDFIRQEYMSLHQQESVLRVDDPFLVWVSF